jgi:hypothetical protein
MKMFFVLAVLFTMVFYFNFCTKKNAVDLSSESRQDTSTYSSERSKRMAGIIDAITCNCSTSQASCKAECTFSECCLCWNPSVETGSCGCYFGVAKCRSSLIGRESAAGLDHKIRFYPQRFERLVAHLRQREVKVDSLEMAFRSLVSSASNSVRSTTGQVERLDVPEQAYGQFFSTYYNCLSTGGSQVQQTVDAYLKSIGSISGK